MLRSVTIDNRMLECLSKKINERVAIGRKITRAFLAQEIWKYERLGCENSNSKAEKK